MTESAISASESGVWRVMTADRGLNMLLARLATWIGLAVTGYLAYPWLMNWYFGKWAGNMLVDGRGVKYTGRPGGLIKLWLKVWALSIITLSIYWWVRGRGAVGRYLDSHLAWAD